MTVLQNVTLAPRKAARASRATSAERHARALLRRIGLEEKADEYPDRLSGGQQQRVAIVRALAMDPKLMLLDEITSALDPQLVSDVLDLVRELAESGMTMIVATHEMGFAREVADKVCFLDGGPASSRRAPPAQIFTEPREPRTREFLSRVLAGGEARVRVRAPSERAHRSASRRSSAIPLFFSSLMSATLALEKPRVDPVARRRARC